jgi:hypothetical protein
VLFEFPPVYKLMGVSKQMQGMDKKYVSHIWCRWKWPKLKTLLVWAFKVLSVWAIFGVKTTLVLCFSNPLLIMKLIGAMTCPKFLLQMKLFHLFLPTPLLVRLVVSPPFVCRLVYGACIMWFIRCMFCQE